MFLSSKVCLLLLLAALTALPRCSAGQNSAGSEYQARRRQAMQLFEQGKRLQALPLLETLQQQNPGDEDVVVALAASLVEHAATLTDQQAAARERLRARGLLERSGSMSTLAQNLLQLLRQMPDSGSIQFSSIPAADQQMRAGEASFSRRDFDEAVRHYSKALAIDPGNYSAALFIGNAYDRKGDAVNAAAWYRRSIKLNPDIETAYRYYADMLAREGDMSAARSMLIHAAVAEPYNRIVWRELKAWTTLNDTDINLLYVPIPAEDSKRPNSAGAASSTDRVTNVADAWRAYHAVRDEWQHGKFKQQFPGEPEYRHSLAEESEALAAAANVLEKLQSSPQTSALVSGDQHLQLLITLQRAGLLKSYVLFSLADQGIAKDYSGYRRKHRDQLERYMDTFVVPPAGATTHNSAAITAGRSAGSNAAK